MPKAFEAQITQKYLSSLSGKERENSGNLKYQSPNLLHLNMEGKNPFILVINSDRSWYYVPPFIEGERGEVTIEESKESLPFQFLNILVHGLKNNDLYSVEGKGEEYFLKIQSSKQKTFGLSQITLKFNKDSEKVFKNILSMELLHLDKRKVEIRLSNIKDQPKFSSDEFVFKVPGNTNINGKMKI